MTFDTSEEPAWVVGTIGVSYDEQTARIIVVRRGAGGPRTRRHRWPDSR